MIETKHNIKKKTMNITKQKTKTQKSLGNSLEYINEKQVGENNLNE